MDYIGKRLEGRYQIEELIGFGGMAVVYKARDLLENRYVAVKILKEEYLESEDFKRRFRNESKAIALLSHPNVVKILDVNFSENIQYIVMEYVDGITLKEYIEQQQTVTWKEAVHFTLQILRALQHAHDNGIVHRDVKPQNVMLLQDGTIKVMDFGIARFARESGRTLSDKAIGSVHYISPEQAKGDDTDEKADIYSVGVMLYEMLTGKVPFDGDSAVAIAIKQMQIEPPLPTAINPKIPIGLEEIIVRAMQKDSTLRYQSASEMLKDIDEFKHDPSVVFEYKYLDSDGTTKYFDKIDSHKSKGVEYVTAPKRRSYTMNILAGVTAACVILAIVALYFFFKGVNSKVDEMVLLNFVGNTVNEAMTKQPDINFKIVEEVQSTEYDVGVIVEQATKAGTTVKKNSTLEVKVSAGLKSIVMPELTNETTSSAKSALIELGITDIEPVQKTDTTVAVGRVVSTDPAAGTELKKGDKVILYVSAGSPDEPVRMPDLVGKTEVEARAELAKYNITISGSSYAPSDLKKGLVFWQSVEPDTKVKKGTTVEIKLSSGASNGTAISIKFPKGADNKEFDFEIYANLAMVSSAMINPAINDGFSLEFVLEDGLINGSIPVKENNEIIVLVNDELFAEYVVNFDTNMTSNITPPKYDLIFENGYNADTAASAASHLPDAASDADDTAVE